MGWGALAQLVVGCAGGSKPQDDADTAVTPPTDASESAADTPSSGDTPDPADTPTEGESGVVDDTDPSESGQPGNDTPSDSGCAVPGCTGPTQDTAAPLPAPWPATLTGLGYDPSLGSVLAGCTPLPDARSRPGALPLLPAELDGDGVLRVLALNLECPGTAGTVRHPIFEWQPALGTFAMTSSLEARMGRTLLRVVRSAAFVDVDEDGDPDLVGAFDVDDAVGFRPVWRNDGQGGLSAVDVAPPVSGLVRTPRAYEGFGLARHAGGTDLWLAGADPFQPPSGAAQTPSRIVIDRFGDAQWEVEVAGPLQDLGGSWTWLPISRDVVLDPWAEMLALTNPMTGVDDQVWRYDLFGWASNDHVDVERSAAGAPVNSVTLISPRCLTPTPGCVTPMGGSMVRVLDEDALGTRTYRDCALVSTGFSAWPVLPLCPSTAPAGWWEDGALTQALRRPPGPGTDLAWNVSATEDVDADGWNDVLVTMGRDRGAFVGMPTRVFLQNPDCHDDACARFLPFELPIGGGHRTSWITVPVQDATGAWDLVHFVGTNGTDPNAVTVPEILRPTLAPGRSWLAVRVGAIHDLRAIGSVVRPRFFDAYDRELPAMPEVLVSQAATWGAPGFNPAIVLGVPAGSVRAEVTVDLPGAWPDVTLTATAWNQPLDVVLPQGDPRAP